MNNELTIRLRLDKSEASASSEQFVAEEKARQKELTAVAKGEEFSRANAARQTSRAAATAKQQSTADERRSQRQLTDSAKQMRQEEAEAARKLAESNRRAAKDQAIAITAANAGYQALLETVRALGQAITDAGAKSKELTQNFTQQRDSLRELAMLMGRKTDNAFTLDIAKFNAAAGFKPEEGRQYLTELYNSGAQYKGKNISDKEFDQYAQQAGQLGVAKQIDPEIVGDMAGGMLGFTNYNRFGEGASEEALGHLNAGLMIMGRGKGNNSVLARQYSMLASAALNEESLRGTFQSPEEVAAAVSIGAEKHDASAAELTKIAARGLRGFNQKDKQAPLLKQAGVTAQDSFMQSLFKLAPLVEKEATTSNVKTEDVLRKYFDEAETDALNVFINKGVTGGGFQDRMQFGATVSGPKPALDEIKQFQSSEVGQLRQEEATGRLYEAEQGEKNTGLELLRRQALNQLIK